jgi:hypothetical protein
MRRLWGYNGRTDNFQRGIGEMMHRTVFPASCAIVWPVSGMFNRCHYLLFLSRAFLKTHSPLLSVPPLP